MAVCCFTSTALKDCLAHTESLAAGCADIPEITPRAAGMMGLKVRLQHLSHMLGLWQLCMQKQAAPSLHRSWILALHPGLHTCVAAPKLALQLHFQQFRLHTCTAGCARHQGWRWPTQWRRRSKWERRRWRPKCTGAKRRQRRRKRCVGVPGQGGALLQSAHLGFDMRLWSYYT